MVAPQGKRLRGSSLPVVAVPEARDGTGGPALKSTSVPSWHPSLNAIPFCRFYCSLEVRRWGMWATFLQGQVMSKSARRQAQPSSRKLTSFETVQFSSLLLPRPISQPCGDQTAGQACNSPLPLISKECPSCYQR